ncbi:PP2C family protein-serine/threonine phosphatase [Cellulomonas sp. C5510]|uniref:PP2C family protein-serine/threonine phosphatase n=1 Tax=Cellulomonas sp. C5510 TaxID=2871170 RepID=UPI001C987B79|nr:PP2C family protein-serine/threonine phosphatase [Cellulomonas sp. C5510]QZN86755.1 serine/threonine-protein phosphatase [Cellulomonas sp. C5510]
MNPSDAPAPRRSRPRRAPGVPDRVRRVLLRWGLGSQGALTLLLVGLTLLASAGIVLARPWFPPSTFVLIELLGAFLLRLRGMVVLCAAIVVQVLGIPLAGLGVFTPGTFVLQGVAVAAVLAFATQRERLGLQGAPGGLMIVDLRDRLAAHGVVPALPDGWSVQTALRSAHREAFSGDFVVTATREHGRVLELVLVDVSGKGQGAGVRSLQLSGALAGLVGHLESADFLPAANAYLLGQAWDEGFASAVHLSVDLGTGDYEVASAGHLPPVHLHSGSGVVELLTVPGGPVLGVVEGACFGRTRGRIEPGDALLLYTDGLVETPGGDLDLGIDRLRGAAEDVLATRRGGADDVIARIGASEGDDRALVLVRRD